MASCSGVTWMKPWPMPLTMVSPMFQAWPCAIAPFPRRDQAGALAGQVDVEFDAEAEAVGHRGDAVDTGAPGDLVEENVAAVLEAATQVERAVAAFAPAVKARVAEVEIARDS